jgi:Domain of unknown function (DUF5655)/Domain of unknown function (DUF4287)
MADPQAATATQLRNIEARTGQSFEALCALIAASGLAKIGEQRSMLMERLGLGYGDANTVALLAKARTEAPATAGADPLDAIYLGPKAHLRVLHEQLSAAIDQLGPHEKAPKKGYVSLRRKKQFATLGPATKEQLELGLNAKELPAAARLKVLPAGGMCQYSVRLSSAAEIDAELIGWLRAAFDAAG